MSSPHTVTCTSLPDTGSQVVVAGPDLVQKLGVSREELFPVANKIKMANQNHLKIIGGLMINISATGPNNVKRSGSHMCYVSENIKKLVLSVEACQDLGLIASNFPNVGSADDGSKNVLNNNFIQFLDTNNMSAYEAASLQHVLHQPPNMHVHLPGTPGFMWRTPHNPFNELDVAALLRSLNLLLASIPSSKLFPGGR